MDTKIELAKSWFVLAQIFIILAGFFFATGGIILTNAVTFTEMSGSLLSSGNSNLVLYSLFFDTNDSKEINDFRFNALNQSTTYMQKEITEISDLVKGFAKKSKEYFYSGFLCVLISVIFWGIGHRKINNV